MRAVLQRVSSASVSVDGTNISSISDGLLILLGVEQEDHSEDIEWLVHKIANMRIFSDSDGKMNLSVTDVKGEILVVSQFTLHASTRKGHRPSFVKAARPEKAEDYYRKFIDRLKSVTGLIVNEGVFGAMMEVALVNSGPVTIIIDSKIKE